MTAAYPLHWPPGFPRAKAREKGAFRTTLKGALDNVKTSLVAFGRDSGKPITGIVLSSNVTLGQERPEDPGVAVWFVWEDEQRCIPVDRYSTVEANLQAIHHVLEARRTELRHGTLALVRAAFVGLKALPAPGAVRPWHVVLGVPATATRAQIDAAHRELIRKHHPDAGGTADQAAEINRARDEGLKANG